MQHRITGIVVTSYTDLFLMWRQLTFSSHVHTYPLKMVSIFMSQDGGEVASLQQNYTGYFPYTCTLLSSWKMLVKDSLPQGVVS